MDIFELLALLYFFVLILGTLLERIKIPWIFSALFLGIMFAFGNVQTPQKEFFEILANLGMYFLLFIVGFEMDIGEIRKLSKHIVSSTFTIIFTETFFGTLLLHFVFNYPLMISALVSLSFSTVGEAVLIPLLDEFKLLRTKLGTYLVGIGTFDDVIEVFVLFLVVILLGKSISYTSFLVIPLLFFLTFVSTKIRRRVPVKIVNLRAIKYHLIAVGLTVFFIFILIGSFADAEALAALLSGIFLANVLPKRVLEEIENEIRILAYGFFAPMFFFWIGAHIAPEYLFIAPWLTFSILLVSTSAKIFSTYLITRNILGKKSLILGTGLCVRFSTSIVIVKLLYNNGFIDQQLFTALVATTTIVVIIVPILFTYMLKKIKRD